MPCVPIKKLYGESMMTSSPFEKSPLPRLVLFMVCLSIAGAFVAGVHYIPGDRIPPSGYPQ